MSGDGSMNRRDLLAGLTGAMAAGLLPDGLAFAQAPRAGRRRFLLIELAGAVDGLALAVPFRDPNYAKLRGMLALPAPGAFDGVFDLDGEFGLPRHLGALLALWQAQELTIIPAVGTGIARPDVELAARAFATGDATGAAGPGWMGRLSGVAGGAGALSIGLPVPPVLQGGGARVDPPGSPNPVLGFGRKIELLVQDDAVLGTAFAQAAASRQDRLIQAGGPDYPRGIAALPYAMLAARTLARDDGPRLAALRIGGWDSARDQGATEGFLPQRLALVAGMLAAIRQEMGPAWAETAVLVAGWTGRRVAPNPARGTDIGLGQTILLAGGNVAGGQFAGAWRGLGADALDASGAIRPTTDLRGVVKSVLADHLRLSAQAINQVLPAARDRAAMAGLFRI